MMRILTVPLFLSSVQISPATPPDTAEQGYVTVEARFAPATLARGTRGEILISLAPVEGIHISTEPAPELTLDESLVVSFVGKPILKKGVKGYLASGIPLRQRFAVAKNAGSGTHVIKGTLVFFYCSDAEGWCMRARQDLELTLTVGK